MTVDERAWRRTIQAAAVEILETRTRKALPKIMVKSALIRQVREVTGGSRRAIREGIDHAIETGALKTRKGPNNSKLVSIQH